MPRTTQAGTAYIRFKGDFSEVQRQLKQLSASELGIGKASQQSARQTQQAERTRQGAIRDSTKDTNFLSAAMDRQGKATRKTDRDTNLLSSKLIRTNQSLSLFSKSLNLIKWPAFITGAGLAAEGAGALSAGVIGLTGALAPLSGLLAAYPALLGAFGQAAGVVAVAGLKDLTDAMAGNEAALKRLTPEARAFMEQLQEMKPQWAALKKEVQANLFEGIGKGVDAARRNFPRLREALAGTAQQMGNLAERAGKLLGSKGFGRDFTKITASNTAAIGRFGRGAIFLGKAMADILVAARPLVGWLGRLFEAFGRWAAGATQAARESGSLQKFFAQTQNIAGRLLRIVINLGDGLIQMGKAAAPLGRSLLKAFEDASKAFSDWTHSLQGRNAMRDYFNRAKEPLFEFFRLLRDMGAALIDISQGPGMADLIKQIRTELLPVFADTIKNTTQAFGPHLIKLLTAVGKLLGTLAGSSGPLIVWADILTGVADTVNFLLKIVPGLQTSAVDLLGFFAAVKTIDFLIPGKALSDLGKRSARLFGAAFMEWFAATEFGQLLLSQLPGTEKWQTAGTTRGKAFGKGLLIGTLLFAALIGHEVQKKYDETFGAESLFGSKGPLSPTTWIRAISAKLGAAKFKFPKIDLSNINLSISSVVSKVKEGVAGFIQRLHIKIPKIDLSGILGPIKELPGRVKNAVSGLGDIIATPFRKGADLVRGVIDKLRDAFGGIKRAVQNIAGPVADAFHTIKDAADAVVRTVTKVINVFDKAASAPKDLLEKGLDAFGLQSGGVLVRGMGSGDKIPALLEPGEVVWNRKAVKAAGGARRVNAMNEAVPRFAGGGLVGDAQSLVGTGKGIMQLGGLGILAALFEQAKKIGKAGRAGPFTGTWAPFDALAHKWGLTNISSFRPGSITSSGNRSWHSVPDGPGRGRATDYSNGYATHQELVFAKKVDKLYRPKLLELIHTPLGYGIKNGVKVPPYAASDHYDHVHVAFQRGGIVQRFQGGGVPKPAHGTHWAKVLSSESPADSRVTVDEGATLLWQAGLAASTASELARVIPGESGGNARAHNPSGATGLFQILGALYPGNLYDPRINALNAVRKYRTQGFGAWEAARSGPAGKILEWMTRPLTKPGKATGKPKGKGGKADAQGTDSEGNDWTAVLPSWMSAEFERLGGEMGLIAKYDDFAQRAAGFNTTDPVTQANVDGKVGGKTEVQWLQAELQAMAEYRNVLLAARAWVLAKVEEFKTRIGVIKWKISRLHMVIAEASQILHGNRNRFSPQMAQEFHLPTGRLGRRFRQGLPDRIKGWRQKIADHQADIAIFADHQTKTQDLWSGSEGVGSKLAELQGFVTDPALEFAAGLNLGDPSYETVFGGEIGRVLAGLKTARETGQTDAAGTATATDNTELEALLRQLADEANRRALVSELALASLSQSLGPMLARVPTFQKGGVVPGPTGQAQPAILHGGEVVLRADQAAALGQGPMYADIYIGGEKIDEMVQVRLRAVQQRAASRAQRSVR